MIRLGRFFEEQLARMRGSLTRQNFDREFDEEVEAHLALLTERSIRRGLSPDEARYAARKQFGGVARIKDELRDRGRFRLLEALLQDSAYVLRQFRKSPLFAIASILTLALGIGANTAIFTLVDQLVLRLLPIQDPQQVVALAGQGEFYGGTMGHNTLSYTTYQTIRDRNRVFDRMMCRREVRFTATVHSESDVLSGELVSGNYFPLLGVRSAVGRVFNSSDDLHPNAHPVAVLSYSCWKNRFAGNDSAIGSTILVNNYPLTIIGVSQPGFSGLEPGLPTQLFVPVMMTPKLFPHDDFGEMFDSRLRWVNVYGRLKPGLTPASAKAGLQPLFHHILESDVQRPAFARATPYAKEQFLRMWLDVIPGGQGNAILRRQYQQPLLVLAGAAGFVLLIACANLASLLTARAAVRQKEIAVRLAIGSSRARIVQQLLTESLLLALAGGVAGIGVALLMLKAMLAFLPDNAAGYTISSSPDLHMLAFAIGLSLLTGLLFGVAPALQAARPNIVETLKAKAAGATGGRHQIVFRKVLVAVQIALSLLLLIGASLFIRSLGNLRSVDPGFQTQSLLQFETDVDSIGYDLQKAHAFYNRLEPRLERLPGVEAAGIADNPVLAGSDWENGITVAGHANKPGERTSSYVNAVSPGYFRALGIHLLSGRVFRASDTAKTPKVVVVNESFAKHYFGRESALGRRIGRGSDDPGTPTDMEIIGVVNDTNYENLQRKAPRQIFLCGSQAYQFNTTVYLKVAGDPRNVLAAARRVVHEMEPRAPILKVKTVQRQLEESLATERMIASLSTGFSVLATALSVLGLYGVMAYMVTQRAREIGIRVALGALFGNVIWLVMREVVLLVLTGIAVALPLAFGLARFVHGQLYGVQPADPVSVASAVLLLAAIAMFAGYLPARRAAASDPLQVLRYE